MDWQAFWLTTRLAVLVAATLVVVGLPIAYWIAYSRWLSQLVYPFRHLGMARLLRIGAAVVKLLQRAP